MEKPRLNILILLSLLLLLPVLCITVQFAFTPLRDTLEMSRQDIRFTREDAEPVGNANYERLADDDLYQTAQSNTLRFVLLRLGIIAVLPPLLGGLIGIQGRLPRWINRLALTLVGVCVSPIVIAMIWRIFIGDFWNFNTLEPSPLDIPESLELYSAAGARTNLLLLDSFLTTGIALAVLTPFYAAAIRGRQWNRQVALTFLGVWLISLILTALSSTRLFELPYLLTRGGPGTSTTTLPFYFFQRAFAQLRVGYAAAMASAQLMMAIVGAFLSWLVMTGFNLRLRYQPASQSTNAGVLPSIISLPLIFLAGLPLVGLVIWGVWFMQINDGETPSFINWDRDLSNTLLVPWMIIWVVQLPLAYLTGLVLGYLRPLGRIGSSLLFLPILVAALLPDEMLSLAWYFDAREAEALNQSAALVYPWVLGGLSFIMFKLYFDGAHETFQEARAAGQPTGEAFLWRVFLPSLPLVILVGAMLSFLAGQEVFWAHISLIDPDVQTLPLTLIRVSGILRPDAMAEVGTVAVQYLLILALPFGVLFAILQLAVVDRLVLVSGTPAGSVANESETVNL